MQAYCIDTDGQTSLTNSVTFDFVVPNGAPPGIAITSPAPGQIETNQAIFVYGTTTVGNGQADVAQVFVQLNGNTVPDMLHKPWVYDGTWFGAQPTGSSGSSFSNWAFGIMDLTPGSNTLSAYCVDANGHVSATNSVTFDYVVTPGAGFAGLPGTPLAEAGSEVIIIAVGGGQGTQPITYPGYGPSASNALAGDFVFLINANNGINPTNWEAVLQFINPADLTGTNGLNATEYQTFFQTNAPPGYFANFPLLPNVIYLPPNGTNLFANSAYNISATAVAFGPGGGILTGQEAIILYEASAQPSSGADLSLSGSAAPEPVAVGNGLFYSLTVSNAGPSVANGVVISNRDSGGRELCLGHRRSHAHERRFVDQPRRARPGRDGCRAGRRPANHRRHPHQFVSSLRERSRPRAGQQFRRRRQHRYKCAVVYPSLPGTPLVWANSGGAVVVVG